MYLTRMSINGTLSCESGASNQTSDMCFSKNGNNSWSAVQILLSLKVYECFMYILAIFKALSALRTSAKQRAFMKEVIILNMYPRTQNTTKWLLSVWILFKYLIFLKTDRSS